MSILKYALEQMALLDPDLGLELESKFGTAWESELATTVEAGGVAGGDTIPNRHLVNSMSWSGARGWKIDWAEHSKYHDSGTRPVHVTLKHVGNVDDADDADEAYFDNIAGITTSYCDWSKLPELPKGSPMGRINIKQGNYTVLDPAIPKSWANAANMDSYYFQLNRITQSKMQEMLVGLDGAIKAGMCSNSKKLRVYSRAHSAEYQNSAVDREWLEQNGWKKSHRYLYKKVVGEVAITFYDNDAGRLSPLED